MNINKQNYEEYLVLYTDHELNERQKQAVEKFILNNQEFKEELEQLQSLKLIPEPILYPAKRDLYRSVEIKGTVPLFRWLYAAAVAVLIIAAVISLNPHSTSVLTAQVADSGNKAAKPAEMADNTNPAKGDKSIIKNNAMLHRTPVTGKPPESIKPPGDGIQNINASDLHNPSKNINGQIKNTRNSQEGLVNQNDLTVARPYPAREVPADQQPKGKQIAVQALALNNGSEFKVNVLLPGMTAINIPDTSKASLTETGNDEAVVSENHIRWRKNVITKFLDKASRFINKTAELRNTQQINIRIGKYEIALH